MTLLTGMTEDGTEVPVQVKPDGRLVAEGLPGPAGGVGPAGPAGPQGPQGVKGDTGTTDLPPPLFVTSDAVKVGGTTAAPNITLKADGSAEFHGDVVIQTPVGVSSHFTTSQAGSGAWKVGMPASSTNFALSVYAGGGFADRFVFASTGDFILGGTLPSAPNITLSAAGNIRALGAVSRVYADNTAAKAGGLGPGDVYRTATGQLMIAF